MGNTLVFDQTGLMSAPNVLGCPLQEFKLCSAPCSVFAAEQALRSLSRTVQRRDRRGTARREAVSLCPKSSANARTMKRVGGASQTPQGTHPPNPTGVRPNIHHHLRPIGRRESEGACHRPPETRDVGIVSQRLRAGSGRSRDVHGLRPCPAPRAARPRGAFTALSRAAEHKDGSQAMMCTSLTMQVTTPKMLRKLHPHAARK